MLATTIWFLFITQSFAKDLASHAEQQVLKESVDNGTPMDYLEGINFPNPHYKINYIYEQKRTDEDTEIEVIEEEIGKYIHYQSSTTTTSTEPQQNIDDVNEDFKEKHGPSETPNIIVETHDHKYEKEEVTSIFAPMPPAPKLRKPIHPHFPTALRAKVHSPPIKQREEIKEVPNTTDLTGFHLDRPYFPARVPAPHRHTNRRLHISPTTSEAPVEVEAQTNHVSTEKHLHLSPTTQVPLFKNRNGHALAKHRPILHHIKEGSIGLAPRPMYRGSYKFSWDDINDMHTSTVPKISQLKENPIPSVPTLSPWYDGYGK